MWGLGNDLSRKVCLAHLNTHTPYCWDPHFWQDKSKNWTLFWELHGHKISKNIPRKHVSPVGAAVHIRCGDVIIENVKGYSYACRRCLVDALQWLLPYTQVTFVVGGHKISRNNADKARQQCARAVSHYTTIFHQHNFDVTVRYTREMWEDWWFLHQAHKVLALVPSSFSFTAKAHDLLSLKIIGTFDIPPVWHYCDNVSGFRLC